MIKNIKRKIEDTPSDYLNKFFEKLRYSFHNVNLKIYWDYSPTLPSPKIQVYLNEFLNSMIKAVKYASFTS